MSRILLSLLIGSVCTVFEYLFVGRPHCGFEVRLLLVKNPVR